MFSSVLVRAANKPPCQVWLGSLLQFFVAKGVFWLKSWKSQGDLRTVIPLKQRVQQMCRQGPLDQIGAWGNLLLHQLKLLFCLSFSRCQTSEMHTCGRISKLVFFSFCLEDSGFYQVAPTLGWNERKKGDRGAKGERLLWCMGCVAWCTSCVRQSLKEVPAVSVN